MKKTIPFIGILLFMLCFTGCEKHTHEFIHISERKATCGEIGIKEHWKCIKCKKYFLDSEGKNEVEEQETHIEKEEHIYDMNNIKWEWLDNYEKAEAVLTCKNDETHQEAIDATVISEENVHKATIVYKNVEYTDIKRENGSVGLEYQLNQDNASYSLIGIGTCTNSDIVVADEYNGLPVTSIGEKAFYQCSDLTSITIPDSVTRIGAFAFECCVSLTSITLPSGITSIEKFTFSYCRKLASITIPDSVTRIERDAFSCCYALTNLTLPSSITSLGESAFSICENLTNVTLMDGLIDIGDSAFFQCMSLTSITLPNSVKTIGNSSFSACISLTNIVMSNNLTSIGDSAFYDCRCLTNINLPNSLTTIGESAFKECISLTAVNIPNGITAIKDLTFFDCQNLTSLILPDSITTIGSSFISYTGITNIIIPDSVTNISTHAFFMCENLTSVTFENTNGWFVTKDVNETTGITVDVSDVAMNAKYLTYTYGDYYWKRS